jgi:hypothetical protein
MKLTYASEIDELGRRMVVCGCGFSRLTHVPIERIVHRCETYKAAVQKRQAVSITNDQPFSNEKEGDVPAPLSDFHSCCDPPIAKHPSTI